MQGFKIARERFTEHVGFYVTPAMKEELDNIRKTHGASESDLMRFIVRSFLEKNKDNSGIETSSGLVEDEGFSS